MYKAKSTINNLGLKDGNTQLINAAFYNSKELAKKALELGADVNIQNHCGNSALIEAASHGHNEIVQLLIKAGASLEIRNNNGDNALMAAIKANQESTIMLLIEAGSDPSNITITNPGSPLAQYCWSVEYFIYDLKAKLINHEDNFKIESSVYPLVINYNYFILKCHQIGIEDVDSFLRNTAEYFKEYGINLVG